MKHVVCVNIKRRVVADPTKQTHGYSGYRARGCRCEICSDAAANLRKRYRKVSDNCRLRLDPEPLIAKLREHNQLIFIDTAQVHKWRERGMDIYNADKWCLKFGWHPSEVFGQAFYVGCFDQETDNV